MKLTERARSVSVMAAAFASGLALLLAGPIHQPQSYHSFADVRTFFAIPNFANVISNLPFLWVGFAGIGFLLKQGGSKFTNSNERWPYAVFFAGLAFTFLGSSYYHWRPNDATLVWDRLPMTLAFAGLFAAFLNERVTALLGTRLLFAFLVFGIASIAYWQWSGDLRPYVFVQFFPLLSIPLMLIFFPASYTRGAEFGFMIFWYAIAKLFELLDRQIFMASKRFISGHTLKHLAAAVACYVALRMLKLREPISTLSRTATASS
jgi:hypothetical protein